MDYILWDDRIPFTLPEDKLAKGDAGLTGANINGSADDGGLPISKRYRDYDLNLSITPGTFNPAYKAGVAALLNVSSMSGYGSIALSGEEVKLEGFPQNRIVVDEREPSSDPVQVGFVPLGGYMPWSGIGVRQPVMFPVKALGSGRKQITPNIGFDSERFVGHPAGVVLSTVVWTNDGTHVEVRFKSTDPDFRGGQRGPELKGIKPYVFSIGAHRMTIDPESNEPYNMEISAALTTYLSGLSVGNNMMFFVYEKVDIGAVLIANKWTSVANQRTMKIDPINPQLLSSAESGDPIVGVLGSRRKRVTLTWVGDLWGDDAPLQGVYTLLDKLADRRRKVLLRIHTRPPATKHYIYIFGILERAASVMGGRPETISATFLTDGMGQDDCA